MEGAKVTGMSLLGKDRVGPGAREAGARRGRCWAQGSARPRPSQTLEEPGAGGWPWLSPLLGPVRKAL